MNFLRKKKNEQKDADPEQDYDRDARPVNDRRSQMIINDFLTKELHTQALFVNFQLVSTDIIIVMSHTV